MNEEIKKIVDEYGKEILLDRTKFMTIFTTNNPDMQKEKIALALALDEKVNELLVNCNEEDKRKNLIEAKRKLSNVPDLSQNDANDVLISLIYALGWDKSYVYIIREDSNSDKNDKEKDYQRSKEYSSNYAKTKSTLSINPFVPILLIIIVVIATVIIIFGTHKNNPPSGYASVKYVEDEFNEIFSDTNYDSYDIEKKKEICIEKLKKLEKQKYIKDIKYVEETSIYEFKYNDGTHGGLMLDQFKEDYSKGNNKDELKIEKNAYEELNLKAKFMYGLGNDGAYKIVKKTAETWNNNYISTTIDDYCTVEDFRTGLQDNNLIIIGEHGSFYENTPIIATEEVVNEDNMLQYNDDIKKGNIVIVTYKGDTSGKSYYCIMPSFFTEHYKNNELDGSIVYIECCYGYKNDKLVKSFESSGANCVIANSDSVYMYYDLSMVNTFVDRLLQDDTTSAALNYAKSIWGYDDEQWANKYLKNKSEGKETAETIIHCGHNVRLKDLVKNTNKGKKLPENKEEKKLSEEQALKEGNLLYETASSNYWGGRLRM